MNYGSISTRGSSYTMLFLILRGIYDHKTPYLKISVSKGMVANKYNIVVTLISDNVWTIL